MKHFITSGIAFNGTNIVFALGTEASNKRLRELDANTGVISSPLSGNLGHPFGIGFFGPDLLVTDGTNVATGGGYTIHGLKLDPNSYASNGTFDLYSNINGVPYGLGSYDNDLFVSMANIEPVINRYDSDLSLVDEITFPFGPKHIRGFAFIDNDLFVAERATDTIYRFDLDTTIVVPKVPEPATISVLFFSIVSIEFLRCFRYRQQSSHRLERFPHRVPTH